MATATPGFVLIVALGFGCGSDVSGFYEDSGSPDGTREPDGPAAGVDGGNSDASLSDARRGSDAKLGLDGSLSDASDAPQADASLADAAPLDSSQVDASRSDAGQSDEDASPPDAASPDAPLAFTPCQTGPGQSLWRLRWQPGQGGFATVEVWDNGCEFSLADQACRLSGEPHDSADFGPGIEFNSSTDFFRVRFSVAGESFDNATLFISAHADGSGIPNAVLESPIHGSLSFAPTVPISQHRTYAVDWSDFLTPSDQPSLTAVTLRSQPIGLAVSFMELCVE